MISLLSEQTSGACQPWSAFGTKQTYQDSLLFVRFWGKADIGRCIAPIISAAFDPKRTWAGRFCCDARA